MKSDMEVDNMKFKKIIIISIVISVILLICSLLLPNINIDKDTIGYNSNDIYNIKAYNTIRDINKYIKISDNIDKKIIQKYLELSADQRDVIKAYLRSLCEDEKNG